MRRINMFPVQQPYFLKTYQLSKSKEWGLILKKLNVDIKHLIYFDGLLDNCNPSFDYFISILEANYGLGIFNIFSIPKLKIEIKNYFNNNGLNSYYEIIEMELDEILDKHNIDYKTNTISADAKIYNSTTLKNNISKEWQLILDKLTEIKHKVLNDINTLIHPNFNYYSFDIFISGLTEIYGKSPIAFIPFIKLKKDIKEFFYKTGLEKHYEIIEMDLDELAEVQSYG